MSSSDKDGIESALKDIYGDEGTGEVLKHIRSKNPGIDTEKALKEFEQYPTSNQSSFGREPNLEIVAEKFLTKEKPGGWTVLCAGCGKGIEPFELTARALKDGAKDFKIDAFDVSKEAITEAKSGTIVIELLLNGSLEDKFVSEGYMTPVKLDEAKEKHGYTGYQFSKTITDRVNFGEHDLINGPYKKEPVYDVVICNNVLLHYPGWTRELMLANLLQSAKDGAKVYFERVDLSSSSQERLDWLRPYIAWKQTLEKFGLKPMKLEENYYEARITNGYEYDSSKNQYLGRHFAIREKKLVEI